MFVPARGIALTSVSPVYDQICTRCDCNRRKKKRQRSHSRHFSRGLWSRTLCAFFCSTDSKKAFAYSCYRIAIFPEWSLIPGPFCSHVIQVSWMMEWLLIRLRLAHGRKLSAHTAAERRRKSEICFSLSFLLF